MIKRNHIFQLKLFLNKKSSPSIIIFCGFLIIVIISNLANAQSKTHMSLFAISPEWNGKEFCDSGNGFKPSRISAPLISYSGNSANIPLYNYTWEQRINGESWVEIALGKSVRTIPSCYPAVLYYKSEGIKPILYNWRLKLVNVSSKETLESEIFSLSLMSSMSLHKMITQNQQDKNKYNVDLRVVGGLAIKSFEWKSLTPKVNLTSTQKNAEDPVGLPAGEYQITIKDGCSSVVQTIQLNPENINQINQSSN